MAVIRQYLAKLNSLSLRERSIVFIALLGIIIFAWYSLLIEPLARHKMQIQNEIVQKQKHIGDLKKQIVQVQKGERLSPAAEKRARIASLKFDIDKLNERLKNMTGGLIDPASMTHVLGDILTRKTDLDLISVESLPSKPLIEAGKKQKTKASVPQVYMHGVRIKFKGGYLPMLAYLKALEGLPWRLYWGNIDYDVKNYPEAYGTLDVYTLSMQQGWIGV